MVQVDVSRTSALEHEIKKAEIRVKGHAAGTAVNSYIYTHPRPRPRPPLPPFSAPRPEVLGASSAAVSGATSERSFEKFSSLKFPFSSSTCSATCFS